MNFSAATLVVLSSLAWPIQATFALTPAAPAPPSPPAGKTASAAPSATPAVKTPTPAAVAAQPVPTPPGSEFPELRKNLERITLENSLAEQKLRQQLAGVMAERQKLDAESGLKAQQMQVTLAEVQGKIAQLDKQTELVRKQLDAKDAERRAKLDPEIATLREQLAKQQAQNDLWAAQAAQKIADYQMRMADLDLQQKQMGLQRATFESELVKLNAEIDLRDKRDAWKSRVNHAIEYTKEPFKDGVLTVSDRRIVMDDVIMDATADYVTQRIDYFNNQNQEFPIFLIINTSPGGSVMAGYRILKAMAGSPAPVYVIVKSFAASMAANIATQAAKSFAYPNAIILHHQVSGLSAGNLTEQKESVREMDEWWRRLAQPVAKKMGISMEEFTKRMYAHRSTGDWDEFGDNAQKLKWVDQIVETIRDESYAKDPDAGGDTALKPRPLFAQAEKVDGNGKRYLALPRLAPLDCYYLYNPDGYYRLAP